MPRRLGPAGHICLHVAWAAAAVAQRSQNVADEDVCSTMQTRRGEPDRRVETTAIKAEALDRLVEKQNHSNTAFTVKEGRNGILRKVQSIEAWIDSRPPEVQTVIKAVCYSWATAMILGLVGMGLGIVRWQPPSKYISWKALSEGGAGGGLCAIPAAILLAILSIPSNMMYLSLETRRAMCGIFIFFGALFWIMWSYGLIQPVLNQLASYIYIFALVGAICVVVLADLLQRAHSAFSGPFMALQRMQHQFARLEEKLGLGVVVGQDTATASAS